MSDYSQMRLGRLERRADDSERSLGMLIDAVTALRAEVSAMKQARLPGSLVGPLARSSIETPSS